MRAMVSEQFGDVSVMGMKELPKPEIGANDVLIEVHATALNPVDTKVRQGAGMYGELALPIVGGYDVSGVVVELGENAKGVAVGDEVWGSPSLRRHGANAEYVAVDYRTVTKKPKTLSHVEAAALPLVTITAWEALYERAEIKAGETVLIHAGAGGTGHVGIQLAKARGCRVITTASRAETIAFCKSIGADVVINYREEDVVKRVMEETGGEGVPVVFDTVGGEVFVQSLDCVGYNGRVVGIVYTKTDEIFDKLFRKNATLHLEFMGVPTWNGIRPGKQGEILREAAAMVDAGKLKGEIFEVIGLEDLPKAHEEQVKFTTIGKRVIKVK